MHLCLLEVNLGNASHTSFLLQNSCFSILRAQTYKIVPQIYTVMQVSLLALSELLNEAFLGKEQAPKIRHPKISPSVRDSMVSASQMVSPRRTQSLHSAPQEPPTPPNCPRLFFTFLSCFLLCQSHQLSHPFRLLPKGLLLCNLMHENNFKCICLPHIYIFPRKLHSFNIVSKILECILKVFSMFYSLSLNIHPKTMKESSRNWS